MRQLISQRKQQILQEATSLEKELIQIENREQYIRTRLHELRGAFNVLEKIEIEIDKQQQENSKKNHLKQVLPTQTVPQEGTLSEEDNKEDDESKEVKEGTLSEEDNKEDDESKEVKNEASK